MQATKALWFVPRVATLLLAASLIGSPVAAQPVSKVDGLCRKDLHRMATSLLQVTATGLARCHRQRIAGRIAAATDCNDVANAASAQRIARESAQLEQRSDSACEGDRRPPASEPVALGYQSCPAPCGAVPIDNSYDGLVACLQCLTESQAEATTQAAYGSPSLPLDVAQRSCQRQIGAAVLKYAVRRMAIQERCQSRKERGREPASTDCKTDDPRGRLAREQAKLLAQLTAHCDDAVVATLTGCGSTIASLAACTQAAADAAADAIFDAVYPGIPVEEPGECSDACMPGVRFVDCGLTVFDCDTLLEWQKTTDDGTIRDKDNSYQWSPNAPFVAPDGSVFTDFVPAVAVLLGGSACASPYDCTSGDGATVSCATPPPDGCWRLPEIDELATILDCSIGSPCIDPIFGPVDPFHPSWSATTSSGNASLAWDMDFTFNLRFDDPKVQSYPARAVRSTAPPPPPCRADCKGEIDAWIALPGNTIAYCSEDVLLGGPLTDGEFPVCLGLEACTSAPGVWFCNYVAFDITEEQARACLAYAVAEFNAEALSEGQPLSTCSY